MFIDFSWPARGKLFRKSIFENRQFEKVILYEDFELIPRIVMEANDAVLINKALYHYRIRQYSIMGMSKKGYSTDYLYVAEKM